MSALSQRLRSLFLTTGVERTPAPVGPGSWRFHLTLGRTQLGGEPSPRAEALVGSAASAPRCAGQELGAQAGAGQMRGVRSSSSASPRRSPGPRPGRVSSVGLHPGAPASFAASVARSADRSRFLQSCSPNLGGSSAGFPQVRVVESGGLARAGRAVVLVPRPLTWAQELGGLTVAVVDPEWGHPVPGSGVRLGGSRRAAIRAHVGSLAASLGLALELGFDAEDWERFGSRPAAQRRGWGER